MNDTPETSDRRRIGKAETEIQVIKADAQTTANLLAGIAENQKATVLALESLRLAQYPPFSDVLKTAGVVIMIFGSALTAYFFLTDSRIREATRVLDYRVGRVEQSIVLTPTFVPAPATVPLQPN